MVDRLHPLVVVRLVGDRRYGRRGTLQCASCPHPTPGKPENRDGIRVARIRLTAKDGRTMILLTLPKTGATQSTGNAQGAHGYVSDGRRH